MDELTDMIDCFPKLRRILLNAARTHTGISLVSAVRSICASGYLEHFFRKRSFDSFIERTQFLVSEKLKQPCYVQDKYWYEVAQYYEREVNGVWNLWYDIGGEG